MYSYKDECFIVQCDKLEENNGFTLQSESLNLVLISNGTYKNSDDLKALKDEIIIGKKSDEWKTVQNGMVLLLTLNGNCVNNFLPDIDDTIILQDENAKAIGKIIKRCENLYKDFSVKENSIFAFKLLCELSEIKSESKKFSPLVSAAIENIEESFASIYGVKELSDLLGVSNEHLVRLFKAEVGITPGKFFTKVRIDFAKELLLNREYSLDIIATLCGLSGGNYLCKIFKKETGLTPMQYRSQNIVTSEVDMSQIEHLMYI